MKEILTPLETPSQIWGLGAESVYWYVADSFLGSKLLSVFQKYEISRTNSSRVEQTVVAANAWISDRMALTRDGKVLPTGLVMLVADDPLGLIMSRLLSLDANTRKLITYISSKSIKKMRHSEFAAFFPDETPLQEKLLASFGLLTLVGDAAEPDVIPNKSVLELGSSTQIPITEANWVLARGTIAAVLPTLPNHVVDELCTNFLDSLETPYEPSTKQIPLWEVGKHLGFPLEEVSTKVFGNLGELHSLLGSKRDQLQDVRTSITEHLADSTGPANFSKANSQKINAAPEKALFRGKDLTKRLTDVLGISNRYGKVLTSFVTQKLGLDTQTCSKFLDTVMPGLAEVGQPFISFAGKFDVSQDTSNLVEYMSFALSQNNQIFEEAQALDAVSDGLEVEKLLSARITSNASKMKERFFDQFGMLKLRPHNFVFTLLDPRNLGEEVTEKYAGTSKSLEYEIHKIENEWPFAKTDNSVTYTNATDRLLGIGLERNLQTRVLRIMTPYVDYELAKYASIIRRLISNGFKVRMISRLDSSQRSWKTLQESFLKGLGDKAGNIEYRTFTRFKEFKSLGQLKRMPAGTRKEFGVHAKLFIIGDSSQGAVLLGSANLLENSYNWNPECGVYTEDPEFLNSATAFFDFVWELSANDNYKFGSLAKVPKGPFFPHNYNS